MALIRASKTWTQAEIVAAESALRTLPFVTYAGGGSVFDNFGNHWAGPQGDASDLCKFIGIEGATYMVTSLSYYEPDLKLFSSNGNALIFNNDSDEPSHSSARGGLYLQDILPVFKAPYTGTYFVQGGWNVDSYYNATDVYVYEDLSTMASGVLTGTEDADTIIDTASQTTINALGGNDVITPGSGNDVVDGGAGTDTVMYGARRTQTTITPTTTGVKVYTREGLDRTDSIKNVESLKFLDFTINLEMAFKAKSITSANLNKISELYIAFMNRIPDAEGLAFWIDKFNGGQSIQQIAENFYSAAVQYPSLTGYSAGMGAADFVKVIYKNVLGRSGATAPSDTEVQAWAGELNSGRATKGGLVVSMLNSAHTFKGDATWGWVANLLDNKVVVAHHFAVRNGLSYNSPEESISKGMSIAAAVTPEYTHVATNLIGVTDFGFTLA